MGRADDILRVTERLYAAAGAPQLWQSALEGIIDLVGADHAMLDVRGTERLGAAFVADARVDERDVAQLLVPEAIEMVLPFLGRLPSGVSSRAEVIADAEFARTAMYNEVIRPLNSFHSLHVRGGVAIMSVR